MNLQSTFTDTNLAAIRLKALLHDAAPLSGSACTDIWLSAIAALAPHLDTAEVLGAWPLQQGSSSWWCLVTNLGFVVSTHPATSTGDDGHACWCWLRADGDIWLSYDGTHIWQSRTSTMIRIKGGLPRGKWVKLLPRGKAHPQPVTMADILVGSIKPVLPSLLFSSLLVQGLGVLLPVFIMAVYDHVIDGRAQVGYNGLLCGLVTILLTEAALRRIRGSLLVNAGLRAETIWVNRVVAHLIHLPAALVERASLSSQLNRLRGIDIYRDMATSPVILGMLDVPFVAIVLVTLFLIAGQLVLVPLLLIATYLGIMLASLPWVKSVLRRQAGVSEIQQSLVLEASQNQLSLRADGLTDVWMERLETNGRQASRLTASSTFMQHLLEVISLLGSSIAGLLTLSYGMAMVQQGQLSAGGLVASMMLVWRMLAPLSLLCTALPRLVQLFQTAVQLADFLNIPTETSTVAPPSSTQLAQPVPHGEINISGATLRYMREHGIVLNNLTSVIHPGQLVTIMGANGSGKSTLLKILVGLYPLQGGVVRLDGVDTRQWDPERLRSHIAYLPQQPDMFADTVATNLRLANPLATDARLWQALELADAIETVRQFDNGLHQHLASIEVPELFHHQLCLARLYLHEGPVILCDELPATLMSLPAGQNFCNWILAQRGTRTVLVVSHNPVLVQAADSGIGLRTECTALVGPASQVLRQLHAPAQTSMFQSVSLGFNDNISSFGNEGPENDGQREVFHHAA